MTALATWLAWTLTWARIGYDTTGPAGAMIFAGVAGVVGVEMVTGKEPT